MTRTVIFASYSKSGTIADYVLYYLQGLKTLAETIVFIADNEVLPGEEEKLRDLVTHCECKRHGGYDFGSYRRGYEWLESIGLLDKTEEIILCNDSCYGPVTPFVPIFEEMDSRSCDFWGISESHQIKTHLQSYFLVFKKQVFASEPFRKFISSLTHQENYNDYIAKYELCLTEYLCEAGFSFSAYLSYSKYAYLDPEKPVDPTIYPLSIVKIGMPFIKRKVLTYAFEAYLQESLTALMDYVKEVNETLYNVILADIPNIYSHIEPAPKDICYEMANLVEKTMNRDKALSVYQHMIREVSERKFHASSQFIQKHDQLIKELDNRIKQQNDKIAEQQREYIILEDHIKQQNDKILEQQREYNILAKKNRKHLKHLRFLVVLCIIVSLTLIACIVKWNI